MTEGIFRAGKEGFLSYGSGRYILRLYFAVQVGVKLILR